MTVDIDTSKLGLSKITKQIPYAAMLTIKNLVYDIRDAQTSEVKAKFGGPLPMGKSSVFCVTLPTKDNLVGTVKLSDGCTKNGIDYQQKIGHHFTGGQRSHKKSEARLMYNSWLDKGEMYTFGDEAKLTKGGYISAATLNKIFASARVKSNKAGFDSTARYAKRGRPKKGERRKKSTRNRGFFVVGTSRHMQRKGNWLSPGIYERDRGDVKPMLIFVGDGKYKRIFDFGETGRKILSRRSEKYFYKNIEKAIRSAR